MNPVADCFYSLYKTLSENAFLFKKLNNNKFNKQKIITELAIVICMLQKPQFLNK